MDVEEPAKRLDRIVAAFEGRKRFLVQTHNNPDPDSIACALAVRHLVQRYTGHDAVIAFGGIIGRSENRAMVRELGVPLMPAPLIDYDDYDFTAVCDTQPGTNYTSFPPGFVPTVVIDHHPAREASAGAEVAIIEPGYGATSTLVGEMLLAKAIPIPTDLATALFYGIKSETRDLVRDTTLTDVAVYRELEKLIDRKCLARIEDECVPRGYFQDVKHAVDGAQLVGDIITSELGTVRVPEMVPEMADYLLRADCAKWTCITGDHKGTLYVSFRTRDEEADAGAVMEQLMAGGRGSGGGHPSMAGGQVVAEGPEAIAAASRSLVAAFLDAVGTDAAQPEPLVPTE